jgi:TetR/AcrR family acrAB operon transcriptional repressor
MYERGVRRTAEDTAATRAALIDAALFTFARDGFDRATLAGIAEAAGVTRGAVYHHFADKDALLTAVLGDTWDVVAAPVWAALDAPGRGSPRCTPTAGSPH